MIQLDVEVLKSYRNAILSYIEQIDKWEKSAFNRERLGQNYHYLAIADHVIGREGLVEYDWYLTKGNFDGMTLSAAHGTEIF